MDVIYQSVRYRPEIVVSTYARLYSDGDVKMFDVDVGHKTVREWWVSKTTLSVDTQAKLKLGEQVLVSGLTMQQRAAR